MSKKESKGVYIRVPDKGYVPVPIQGGFIVGHTKDMKLVMELVGELGFEDAMDDVMSGIYHICTVSLIESGNTKEAKKEIYTRAVQAFSLIMDKFYPENKDIRTDVVLPEELEKIMKDRNKNQQ